MIIANVILATQIPYVMAMLLCFLVIPIELGCFFAFQHSVVGFWSSLGLIVLANIVSVAIGYFLMAIIPVPVGFAMHEAERPYFYGILVGFFLAFLLSWFIEYSVVRLFRRRFAFIQLRRTMCVANAASYMVVLIVMLWRF